MTAAGVIEAEGNGDTTSSTVMAMMVTVMLTMMMMTVMIGGNGSCRTQPNTACTIACTVPHCCFNHIVTMDVPPRGPEARVLSWLAVRML